MKTFTVKENCSLKDFTSAVFPQGAFCLDILLRKRDVKVNGVRTDKNIQLHSGDSVAYYTTREQEQKPSHSVVYSDENIFVADKFSGVSSEGLFAELCEKGEYYAVHRLDTNTTGLIIFAKNKQAEAELLSAFKERQVVKKYRALLKNNFRKKTDILTAYLFKDAKNSKVSISDKPAKGGVKIVTEYAVLEERGDIALAEIVLHTGKTHQIRAHMAHIGCPVLGDEKYGDRVLNSKYNKKRQQLVSAYIRIERDGMLGYLKNKPFSSEFSL